MNLMVKDDLTRCDECKREEEGLAFIETEQNQLCLFCATNLNILDGDHVQHIKEFGELQGGKIGKAIEKTLNVTN